MKLLDYLKEKNIDYKEEDGKIVVHGELNLCDKNVTELPEKLSVKGSLGLWNSKITKLPETLSVGRNLDLSYTNITELPEKLFVGWWLDLEGTQITKLPDNLSVGSLNLDAEKITNIAYRDNCGRFKRTIFAAYVNGEIQIAAGRFLGNIEAFEVHIDEEYSGTEALKYKQSARECVKELEEMRSR